MCAFEMSGLVSFVGRDRPGSEVYWCALSHAMGTGVELPMHLVAARVTLACTEPECVSRAGAGATRANQDGMRLRSRGDIYWTFAKVGSSLLTAVVTRWGRRWLEVKKADKQSAARMEEGGKSKLYSV